MNALEKSQARRRQARVANERKAAFEYQSKFEEINELLAKIGEGVLNHENTTGKKNWGHVGDLEGVREKLQNISDQLWNEGEYAE